MLSITAGSDYRFRFKAKKGYRPLISEMRKPMANFNDLIGAFLQNAAAHSSQNRMGNVLENLQKAGLSGSGGTGGAGALACNRQRCSRSISTWACRCDRKKGVIQAGCH
jgi:hypothetical protein